MERLRMVFIAFAMSLSSHLTAYAQVKEVNDPKTTAAVVANTALEKKMEDEHNEVLDTIKSRKKKIESYTASMTTIKELYKMSMQNVKGFGYETVYYKQMVEEFSKIPDNTARALKAINHSPVVNYINSLDYILNIETHAISLIGTFVDIVNNGKVSLSDFTSKSKDDKLSQLLKDAHLGKGDGYNFLDRSERLTLANSLLYDLRSINIQLEQLTYVCQACGVAEMLFNLDPISWFKVMDLKYTVESAILQWDMDPLI